MKALPRIAIVCLSAVLLAGCGQPSPSDAELDGPGSAPGSAQTAPSRNLLIVLDGLRPDYVTPETMPNLYALGERGVVFTNHHAVYPTVTRVNAASISTGAYPETHGLMGNAVFFPEVDATRFLTTSDRANLLRVEEAEGGQLLTAPTLGELLQEAGERLLAVSAGSSGSSFLLNHTVAGGGIIHYEYVLPESLAERVAQQLGPPPTLESPSDERNRYIVDAFLEVGLDVVDPTVTFMWLTDPDTTAHVHGVGHPTSMESIRAVDAELGRLQDALEASGRRDDFNIWVTSDHGFSTHTGFVDLPALVEPFLGTLADGSPRVVAGSDAIYVRDGDADSVSGIVEALQASERVGAIFTRGGRVPGTLSFEVARWDHPRAADILYSPAWTDAENEYGYRGTAASYGTAGHGSTSPFDIHNTLIAAGPDLRSGVEVSLPSSNVDFAPTILSLLGLPAGSAMAGRALTEAFVDGPEAEGDVESDEVTAETPDAGYRVTAQTSVVAGRRYLDGATAER
ncbi:MAG: sulfatase-like hydrolase/transferase [Acidobacteria bacterium]|nr:sulfatase-like hydrolase/transferase [Acidobacteriota bacterium]